MKPLFVLIGTFLVTIILMKLLHKEVNFLLAGRIAMSAMLVFTAIAHFAFSEGMTSMIPDFIPMKPTIVLVTGLMEILFAIGLLFPKYHLTGWVLILFFLAILPANIKASMENINYQTGALDGPGLSYLWFRVPLQLFFILWVYISAIKN